jgi:phosphoglycolate phosphatase-like HAD superfamily hydrolase
MNILKELIPEKEFFVGIDSDGCVFDTMEVKQKEFFIPNAIKQFGLFAISKYVRETWEFVNLYSVTRGINRFPALVKVIELLAERPEIIEMNFKLPDMDPLREWISKETKLGNPAFKEYVRNNPHPSLDPVLRWTLAVNEDIGLWLKNTPPFPYARRSIEKLSSVADAIVVSQTPHEALAREWEEHDIDRYVRAIAGQELGTKTEHIAMAAKGKYPDDMILMIGDAPGDYKAARENNALFFPVVPGHENSSWKRFFDEALGRFLKGEYKGSYQEHLIDDFEKSLPDKPVWK